MVSTQSTKNLLEFLSLTAWTRLPAKQKSAHSLRNCRTRQQEHVSLTRSFHDKKSKKQLQSEEPVIVFNKRDLSYPSQCGRKILKELDAICQESFHKTVQTVLSETPRSKFIVKPSSLFERLLTI